MQPQDGQTAINRTTGERAVYQNGVWVKIGNNKLNPGLQKEEDADIGAIQGAVGMNGMLDKTAGQIQDGGLNLGLVQNTMARLKNFVGASDESSRNFASFRANLEKLRNDSLRLNKGVQTEGDAQRAWNELFTNLNDKDLVMQRLNEIEAINERAIANRRQVIENRRSSQNVGPANPNIFRGSRSNPIDLSKGQSRNVLAPGTFYNDPYGNLRRNDNGDRGNPKIDPATGRQIMDGPAKGRPSLSDIFGN